MLPPAAAVCSAGAILWIKQKLQHLLARLQAVDMKVSTHTHVTCNMYRYRISIVWAAGDNVTLWLLIKLQHIYTCGVESSDIYYLYSVLTISTQCTISIYTVHCIYTSSTVSTIYSVLTISTPGAAARLGHSHSAFVFFSSDTAAGCHKHSFICTTQIQIIYT